MIKTAEQKYQQLKFYIDATKKKNNKKLPLIFCWYRRSWNGIITFPDDAVFFRCTLFRKKIFLLKVSFLRVTILSP